MSVTTLLKDPEVRNFVSGLVTVPKVDKYPVVQVPMGTTDPGRMGSAIDYGIRMWLEARHGGKVTNPWVAEMGKDSGKLSAIDKSIVQKFLNETHLYFKTVSKVDSEFAERCWALAGLDVLYRVGIRPVNLIDLPTMEEVNEIKMMMKGVFDNFPKPKKYCLLNPTFGTASLMVNGADADVIQDDTIIEIKTTKKQRPYLSDYLYQLAFYAALADLSVVDGLKKVTPMKKLGIYFSRHFLYLEWELSELISKENMGKLQDWILDHRMDNDEKYLVTMFGQMMDGDGYPLD